MPAELRGFQGPHPAWSLWEATDRELVEILEVMWFHSMKEDVAKPRAQDPSISNSAVRSLFIASVEANLVRLCKSFHTFRDGAPSVRKARALISRSLSVSVCLSLSLSLSLSLWLALYMHACMHACISSLKYYHAARNDRTFHSMAWHEMCGMVHHRKNSVAQFANFRRIMQHLLLPCGMT